MFSRTVITLWLLLFFFPVGLLNSACDVLKSKKWKVGLFSAAEFQFPLFLQWWCLLITVLERAETEKRLLTRNWQLVLFISPANEFQNYAKLDDSIGNQTIAAVTCLRQRGRIGATPKWSCFVLLARLNSVHGGVTTPQNLPPRVSITSFHTNQDHLSIYHNCLRDLSCCAVSH